MFATVRFDYNPEAEHRIPESQRRLKPATPKQEKTPFKLLRFVPGDKVWHHSFDWGLGVVQRISHASNSSSYEVLFERDGQTRLISPEYAQWRAATDLDVAAEKRRQKDIVARLTETFHNDPADIEHFHGPRWEPFFDGGTKEMLKQLPHILAESLTQTAYGDSRPGPYRDTRVWPSVLTKSWPIRINGLQVLIEPGTEQNLIKSLFPFTTEGTEHSITLNHVKVWKGGIEAQIECQLGDAELTFFDSAFTFNRGWYLAGRSYQFIFCGIAYEAQPGQRREFKIPSNSPGGKALRRRDPTDIGTPPRIDPVRVQTAGMAMLLPASGGDVDDYQFHGPIVEVQKTEILNQPAWRVRAVLLRNMSGPDCDIPMEILVTRRAWKDEAPPQVGQDIEGTMWLQGNLWSPGPETPTTDAP